jgi:putative endonuclease
MHLPAWVYILSNNDHSALYIGVSNDLPKKHWQLKSPVDPKSESRFELLKLVYYEGYGTIQAAVDRERFLKGKTQKWKEGLVGMFNPQWKDLSKEPLVLITSFDN